MRLAPRRESEFVEELKEWFLASDKNNSFVHAMYSITGAPDLHFATRRKDGRLSEFMAEAKYLGSKPASLRVLFNALRENQKRVIPSMAAASMVPIYLIVCIGGVESWWYQFDPIQCAKWKAGQLPPWETLILKHISLRDNRGKWFLVDPNDERLSA